MSKLLFNKPPLVIDPDLAVAIGWKEALILQQIHYWLEINREADRNYHDGHHWTFNSVEAWQKHFKFLSAKQVRAALKSLEDKNLIIIGNFNKAAFDRTKWYRIDYQVLDSFAPVSELVSGIGSPSRANAFVQKGQMDESPEFKGFDSGFREKMTDFAIPNQELIKGRNKKKNGNGNGKKCQS